MAKVDVKCPFCEQTEYVKNKVWEKPVISVTAVSNAPELSRLITLTSTA